MDSNQSIIWLITFAALAASLASLYLAFMLRQRFIRAFANLGSKHNLADTITEYFDKLGITAAKLDNLRQSYEHLADIGARSIQKTGIVRFNPFRDTGGDQSFVLALLDNHDSGFLMTSI